MRQLFFLVLAAAIALLPLASNLHAQGTNQDVVEEVATLSVKNLDLSEAVAVLKQANDLQQAGVETTVLFEGPAVQFVVLRPGGLDTSVPNGAEFDARRREERLRTRYRNPRPGEVGLQPIEPAPSSSSRFGEVRQQTTPQADIMNFISYGGKVVVCPHCMKKYNIDEEQLIKGAVYTPDEALDAMHEL